MHLPKQYHASGNNVLLTHHMYLLMLDQLERTAAHALIGLVPLALAPSLISACTTWCSFMFLNATEEGY